MRALYLCPLVVLACGEAQSTDYPPRDNPTPAGDGLRLAALNDPAKPRPDPTQDLVVTGVSVVAVDAFDETSDGSSEGNIYVQDLVKEVSPGLVEPCSARLCEYSGVTLFDPSYSPPSLRLAAGDVVDVRGRYEEFPGPATSKFPNGATLPEIVGGAVKLRFEYQSPQPVVIPLADLRSYDTGRKWIGMLVTIENIRLFEDGFVGSSGRFSARIDVGSGVPINELPTITNALFPVDQSGLMFTSGSQFQSVTGVVQYFYNFSITPRSVEDLTQ